MEISDFKIRQVVFEIRYDDAYILWDRAGSIAEEITKLWPGAKITEGAPNKQSLKSDDATIVTGIRSSHVAVVGPNSILQFAAQIEETVNVWVRSLNLTKFSRVGTRIMYARAYDSIESASKAIVNLGLVRTPAAPIFNHKNELHQTDIRLLWQDDVSQTQVIIKPEHYDLEIPGLPDNPAEKQTKTADVMLLDIDRATRGTVELSKFRVSDWLEGVRHLVSRDANRILRPV